MLARRFGATDQQVACLLDEGDAEFTPAERAAIDYADELTRSPQVVSDETFAKLREHWSEEQIVEITAVAGLFNYFNRMSNGLRIDPTVYPS